MDEVRTSAGALASAYRRHGRLVADLAAALVDDRADADDVVVGVFGAFGRGLGPDDEAGWRRWMVTETCRRCRDRAAEPARSAGLGADCHHNPLAAGAGLHGNLWAALSLDHRRVLALACVAGWPCTDIATMLGVDVPEVSAQLRAALLTVRAVVADGAGMEAARGRSELS